LRQRTLFGAENVTREAKPVNEGNRKGDSRLTKPGSAIGNFFLSGPRRLPVIQQHSLLKHRSNWSANSKWRKTGNDLEAPLIDEQNPLGREQLVYCFCKFGHASTKRV
jgi:hypothetical protein